MTRVRDGWRAAVDDARRELDRAEQFRLRLIAVAAALLLLVVGELARPLLPLLQLPGLLMASGILLGVSVWRSLRRATRHWSTRAAALWIEEQGSTPPDFLLVTAVEHAEVAADPALVQPSRSLMALADERVRHVQVASALRRWHRLRVRGPGLLSAGALLVWMLPRVLPADIGFGDRGGIPTEPTVTAPLGEWAVRVLPPSYMGREEVRLGDASQVSAWPGSRVEVVGAGTPPSVEGADSARTMGRGWDLRVTIGDSARVLRLERGGHTRQLVLDPRPDSIPMLQLERPVHDSVLARPVGQLPLVATVSDDIGLAEAHFELLVTSGEGERFSARTRQLAATRWPVASHMRAVAIRAVLDIAPLSLKPGDIVHLRAVARDHHPSPTREHGTSETRAIRIARPGESDSLAVEAAAPLPVDSSLLSQRMLLLLTERLDARQRRLERPVVMRESRRLASDQARLRQQVGAVIFQRLGDDPTGEHIHTAGDGHDLGAAQDDRLTSLPGEESDAPVLAVNQPLLAAYNAMWDAGRALEQGDPHAAIPPMRRALAAIEEARLASRIYLRGRPPRVVLDLARIRLAGRDTGHSAIRERREELARQIVRLDARLIRAAALLPRDREAARDSLQLLRLDAVGAYPAFALAIDRVLQQVAIGGELTAAVRDARRVLATVTRTPAALWSTPPSGDRE